MGAQESKLTFKSNVFQLVERTDIPADDPYWTSFWELPESVEDVFSLFSPADIRRTRDASLQNLETLILAVTSRLITLKNHPSFPDPELAPERDALNCIRVLTRILPFVYEAEHLHDWEERFFWGVRRRKSRRGQLSGEVLFDDTTNEDTESLRGQEDDFEEVKPLAEELIDSLTDLLFYTSFTVPRSPTAKSKVTYAIWQSGVGCRTSIGTNKELESNRCEVLRLLLTMTSKSMYLSSSILPVQGVKAITYIATCPEKQVVLSVLCSLLNTTIKYNAASWRLPYDHVVWKDPKQALVIYSLQLLLVLLLYPIPEDGPGVPLKNFYRHFFGRLHRPEDFQFLADGIARVLGQPMQTTTTYLPGSQKSVKHAPETIILFWEALQCNKRFRAFIIESKRAHDFVVLMLFYALEHKTDPSMQGIVRMCVFVLQTMSVEPAFGENLNRKFEAQETLPASIRLSNFRGSYGDYLIISIHTLITGSKSKLDAVYPALLAIVNNIAPYAKNLSISTCSKLMQLFASMSAPSFLLANESNHTLLQSLLESINTIVEHQYTSNANLIYAILRSKKKIEALRIFTLESGQEEIERRARRRKEILGSASNTVASPRQMAHEPSGALSRTSTSTLPHVPEEHGTFAIGDSDDSDDDHRPTPSQSSPSLHNSRTPSIASSADDSTPIQLRGMSEKARGKMPAGAQTFSRQSSTASISSHNTNVFAANGQAFEPTPHWLETWLPNLPLHTILTLIKTLAPHMPPLSTASAIADTPTEGSRRPSLTDSALVEFLNSTVPSTVSHPTIATLLSDPTPIRIHTFEWSPLSLGWYESLLWGFIYAAEMIVGDGASAGTVGVWNGTAVKLFQVQEGKKEGPSLSRPKGAVDAVGSRLVQGVQGLNLGGRSFSLGSRETSVREV
jgi:High-temperature-induced dauer-formation protein